MKPKDSFKFIMPAELEKGEDGHFRVRGLASTETVDQQGEIIIQKGMDLTPIEQRKGILNWDHQKGPENTIGLLDGYQQTDKGLYVEGRLFKNHSKAKAVREIMESLDKGDRGRMGLSVEGKILERDPTNPMVIRRCQINAVALTMNPVNQSTYMDVIKSMSGSELDFEAEAEVNEDLQAEPTFTTAQVMAMIEKALSVGQGQNQPPADRSGGDAMVQSDMKDDEDDIQPVQKMKKKLKKMTKSLYKSNMLEILDHLQILYPGYSRDQIWNSVRDRLQQKFGDEVLSE